MAFIDSVTDDRASEAAAALFEADRARLGFPADIERLRGLGLSDVKILDVVLAAAVRCFVSKTLDALCVQADDVYGQLEPELRKTLTVGRPFAMGA
jgi:hypothetical protein